MEKTNNFPLAPRGTFPFVINIFLWRVAWEKQGETDRRNLAITFEYMYYLKWKIYLRTDHCWIANYVLPTTGVAKSYRLHFQFIRQAVGLFRFLDINWVVKETWEGISLLNAFPLSLFLSLSLSVPVEEQTFSITIPLGTLFELKSSL
jgi:hypothetical protein